MKTRIPRGFSLLELMITVIIVAILAGLALPAFRTYFVRSNLAASANGILAAVNTARAEAVKRNSFVRVNPSSCSGTASWSYGAFVWAPSTTNPAESAPNSMPDTRVISGTAVADGGSCTSGAKITTSFISGAGNTICYNGGGRVNFNVAASACSPLAGAPPLQVKLCDTNGTVKNGPVVDIAVSGRALIQPNATCP